MYERVLDEELLLAREGMGLWKMERYLANNNLDFKGNNGEREEDQLTYRVGGD